jgi:glycerol-3-phosphate acyltransferase PlsY
VITIILTFVAAYLAGSVNFSIILFKILGKEDPRSKFSGNAGTSNVYRMAGKFWAAIVLLLDIGRSAGIALLSLHLLKAEYAPLICFGLILGNRYPCFHRFQGGKGVANYLGFTAALTPLWAGISAIAWVLAYLISRTTFIASFFMILILAAGTVIINNMDPAATAGSVITAGFIILNHRTNIIEYRKKHGRI